MVSLPDHSRFHNGVISTTSDFQDNKIQMNVFDILQFCIVFKKKTILLHSYFLFNEGLKIIIKVQTLTVQLVRAADYFQLELPDFKNKDNILKYNYFF